jgi:hypothetical protein
MGAGVPVVALDAPGVREVVIDNVNGRLLGSESIENFVEALHWVFSLSVAKKKSLQLKAIETANKFSMASTATAALAHYEKLQTNGYTANKERYNRWQGLQRLIKVEWYIIKYVIDAAESAISSQTEVSCKDDFSS